MGVTSNESNLIWEKYLKDLDFVSYDLERDAIDLLLSHDPKKAKQQYEKLSEVISQFT